MGLYRVRMDAVYSTEVIVDAEDKEGAVRLAYELPLNATPQSIGLEVEELIGY